MRYSITEIAALLAIVSLLGGCALTLFKRVLLDPICTVVDNLAEKVETLNFSLNEFKKQNSREIEALKKENGQLVQSKAEVSVEIKNMKRELKRLNEN